MKPVGFPRPIIFAHRGASADAPENTLAAFELAVAEGADAIELDAKLSADGHVVVIHDVSVERTTDGRGAVGHLSLAQLKALDAGSFFSEKFAGERIPTLEEVFETVGRRALINIELTNYASPLDDLPEKVVDLVKRFGLVEQVIFSSFHPLNLLRVRRWLPQAATGLLAFIGAAGAWARSPIGGWIASPYLHPHYSDVNWRLVERLHRAGRRLNVWTVNEPAEMERLFRLQVDGIFTDNPSLARRTLEVA